MNHGPDESGGTGATGGSGASGAVGGSGVGGSGAIGGSGAVGGSVATGGVGASAGFGAVGAFAGAGAVGGSSIAGCSDPDGTGTFAPPVLNGYDVRSITVGENGTFEDACDMNGNLTEYACELGACLEQAPGAEPGWSGGAPCAPPSGWVIPTTVDCSGQCSAGRCFPWCANTGDAFFVTSVDPGVGLMLQDVETGYYFSCTVRPSQLGIDCASPDLVAYQLTVSAPDSCINGNTRFVADHPFIDGPQACNYDCTVAVLID